MSTVGFEFPPDHSQQWDGFNEPGIEHFSGSPFEHLGREITQNTSDATERAPARLLVRRIDVQTSTIPDVDGLRATFKSCLAAAVHESPKAKTFFKEGLALLDKPKVSVLQFADYNTTGVKGPCENGKPFFALMKATGQSKKTSDTATGSFGIGKFAPYTVSALRTVFLTTVWRDETADAPEHYVQGKSILMSHEVGNKTHRGTGFWGIKKNCLPIVGDADVIPAWLRRESGALGSTISILGFQATKDWQKILACSIAESFFGSISRGLLEVDIEGGPSLNVSTISDFFADVSYADVMKDQKGEPERFHNSGYYLRALSSTEAKTEDTQNLHLGNCRLHILVGEHLPKKVAVLRNGMLITDELTRLRRFSEFKEFVAVLECQSEKGNALLRAMEPPAHNDFEPARLPAEQQRSGRVALREIADWVREMLRRHAQDPVAEVTNLDELAEFFGEEEETTNSGGDGDENPQGNVKIRARPLPKRRPPTTWANDDEDDEQEEGEGQGAGRGKESGTDGGGGEGGGGGGDRSSGSGGGRKKPSATALALRNVRAILLGLSRRRIAFTADRTGPIRLELEDSGADTNRVLRAVSTSIGDIVDGGVENLTCVNGERMIIDVELETPFAGTVKVKAHAV